MKVIFSRCFITPRRQPNDGYSLTPKLCHSGVCGVNQHGWLFVKSTQMTTSSFLSSVSFKKKLKSFIYCIYKGHACGSQRSWETRAFLHGTVSRALGLSRLSDSGTELPSHSSGTALSQILLVFMLHLPILRELQIHCSLHLYHSSPAKKDNIVSISSVGLLQS